MSLNHKEIDLILDELGLPGSWIQKILQPAYDTMLFELYGPKGASKLLVSVASGACRIHSVEHPVAKNERPLRFMECLKSRIRGGKILSARQLGTDRIIVMEIGVGESSSPTLYRLVFRLWSGAGNMLLIDSDGCIVDALVRKPEKGEISGQRFSIEEGATTVEQPGKIKKNFEIRDLPGTGNFNQRVEQHYSNSAGALSKDRLLEQAREKYAKRLSVLERKVQALEAKRTEYEAADRFREIGDILMAGGYEYGKSPAAAGKKSIFVETFDFYRKEPVRIQLDASLTSVQNAQAYYDRHRKAESGLGEVERELKKLSNEIGELASWMQAIEEESDPFAIAQKLQKSGTVRENPVRKYPCLWIERDEWTILIGRSAKENDELLRHYAKGPDLWLHARDWAGSYVFIKSRKQKSYPLDLLLDAGMLALYYSSARKNIDGDVYYTPVKYLRRVKNGPRGLVIPTLEKNLHVAIDPERMKQLLSNAQSNGGA